MIDFSHHRGHARQALDETVAFSDAVDRALEITDAMETLIVVTSDHSHSMVFGGYPDRGSSVLCKEISLYVSDPLTKYIPTEQIDVSEKTFENLIQQKFILVFHILTWDVLVDLVI